MNARVTFSITLLSLVFFFWGVITSANALLVPYFQHQFNLSYQQSMWVQMLFYLAPCIASLPTAALMSRFGYKVTLQGALWLSFTGCLGLFASLKQSNYIPALGCILLIAMGVSALQVVANPYVARIGSAQGATRRLTIASTLNSLGTTLGPVTIALAMLTIGIHSVYLLLALGIMLLSWLLYRTHINDVNAPRALGLWDNLGALLQERSFVLGAIALFVYIGVEVSIGTLTIRYLSIPSFGEVSDTVAASLISLYWGGALVGRALYSIFAPRFQASRVLLAGALFAASGVLFAIVHPSFYGALALLAIGLCNSFMYPIIFSQAIEKLGDRTSAGSAVLIMCGLGGGVIPMLQAALSESAGITTSYLLPLAGYLLIALYAQHIVRSRCSLTSNLDITTSP